MTSETHSSLRAQRGPYPLSGLRILDLGTMVAGPVACTLFGDFGAEVIKVEVPQRGDTVRDLGPFVDGECLYWQVEGRNKKSVTLNLRVPEGQALLCRLVEQADAVVENFRPGTLDGWDLGYARLKRHNPKLILLRISGFGQTGPYRARAGYDRIGLAMGGLMGITGFADRPPVRSGTSTADYQTALMGAYALMMAIYRRDTTGGEGEEIDVSLFESIFRFTEVLVPEYDLLGTIRGRRGDAHFTSAPGGQFTAGDGRTLVIGISNDAAFRRLCAAMGRPDIAGDPLYARHSLRWKHREALNAVVAQWVGSLTSERVGERLDQAQVAWSLVQTVEELVQNPHCQARESIASVVHPRIGPVRMAGVVPRFQRAPSKPIDAAPALGEHNAEIYESLLKVPRAQLDEWTSRGVI
jgi:crotonobetainyl-CoA:carnitine CoA-transferase CaiB-like acyl-CoA transferase